MAHSEGLIWSWELLFAWVYPFDLALDERIQALAAPLLYVGAGVAPNAYGR
jgi:hypothetical protein